MADSPLDELRRTIWTCPIIDNHAHNILRAEKLNEHPFTAAVTEARGDALKDTPKSLPGIRAAKQLCELYECDPVDSWDVLEDKRLQILSKDPHAFVKKCFAGTWTLLLDDLLADEDTVHPYHWHDQFTQTPTRRIVRIETVAARIMQAMCEGGQVPDSQHLHNFEHGPAWVLFLQAFETAIMDEIGNPDVAGFKSVCCYRTGLDVTIDTEANVTAAGEESFRKYLYAATAGLYRVDNKGLNDCLVYSTCKLLATSYRNSGIAKPLQFHTGLGDNDISLLKANPACLQPLIEHFPTVTVVLLHSSYPYTREAGYLATVYSNAYLDLGEVFPMVSHHGQAAILREALEMTPISKLLWSTDGHDFPETFWLANEQFRLVLEETLVDFVQKGYLSEYQGVQAVEDILFRNSNKIYSLGFDLDAIKSDFQKPLAAIEDAPKETNDAGADDDAKAIAIVGDARSTTTPYNVQHWTAFRDKSPKLEFVYVQWLDYMAILRCRMLPIEAFDSLVHRGTYLNVSFGNTGNLQDDSATSATTSSGQILVKPELTSLRQGSGGSACETATVMAFFLGADETFFPGCPRSVLGHIVEQFETTHGIQFLLGFEIEVTFLRIPDPQSNQSDYVPLDTNKAWSTLSMEQYSNSIPTMTHIVRQLREVGIHLEQFHSESGPGQYEFIMQPLPPLAAIDTLVQVRLVIQQAAAQHGLRATLHPTPVPSSTSGAHAHISMSSTSLSAEEKEKKETSFFAGVLENLKAICAFTLPIEDSYERVVDDHWTNGTWIAWGTQNRETPLRKIKPGRWEVRCIDGMANPYLAMSAIFAAGLVGITEEKELVQKDCTLNPSRMTDEQRAEHNIKDKLPDKLEVSLAALEGNEQLKGVMGAKLVDQYVLMKRAEGQKLGAMSKDERRKWLIERY